MNVSAPTRPTRPTLSVVIIGRNEGERLVRCLDSVRAMHVPEGEVEILYVDSASTDGSPQRAESLGATVITVHPQRPTAALGRNAGWRAASAPCVLFLDGDTILQPDFVLTALHAFSDPQIGVVWGHRREIHPEASVYNRVLDLDWVYPPGPSAFCGGDALMRRSVLEEVGGYDETLIAGEEPEMCQRLRSRGHEILHIDQPMTGHDLAMTRWAQYWKRATRAGHAYAEVAERSRDTALPLWQHEVRHHLVRGIFWLLFISAGVAGCIVFHSAWPLVGVLACLLALSAQTAHAVRWKSPDRVVRFLYGLHSHFQHIPILCGQLGYWRDRWAGRRRTLIEYKEVSA